MHFSAFQLEWAAAWLVIAFMRGILQGLWIRRRRQEPITANYGRWEYVWSDGRETLRWIDHPVRRFRAKPRFL